MSSNGQGFRWAYEAAVERSGLKFPTRIVLTRIAARADARTGMIPARFMPSAASIAAAAGMSERAVHNHLRIAESAGWLIIERRPGRKSSLVLAIPDAPDVADVADTGRGRPIPALKARPTLYKGIQMRSRLEADFAACLDRGGATWEYEPVCFAGPAGQWLPDFRVTWNGKRVYVEIKPGPLRVDQIDQVLNRMTVAWLSEPDADLHLAIWQFNKPQESLNLMGFPDRNPVWWCHEGTGELRMWRGMGQSEQLLAQISPEEFQQAVGELKQAVDRHLAGHKED